MIRFAGVVLLVIFLVGLVEPVDARPEFLERFMSDPYRRADVDGCKTCHDDPEGGGPRNDFGTAFDDASRTITPMLRATFPDRFGYYSSQLADGSSFSFSDPENKFVVFEKEDNRVLIDLVALTAEEEVVLPPPANRMSFFVTSEGPGNGGHLEGLAGADRHCQALAEATGASDQTWRAYLSTSFMGDPAINAGDRIGTGPWYNANGLLVARGVADLHQNERLSKQTILNEKGEVVNGRSDDPNRHDILTGSLADGTSAVGMNCNNWTSSADSNAMVGHHDREGGGDAGTSWNAAHPSRGCSQEDLRGSGGDGLFYCFAMQ